MVICVVKTNHANAVPCKFPPKYCIVSASLPAAAFALKCRTVRFYIWCVGAGFYPARRFSIAPLALLCRGGRPCPPAVSRKRPRCSSVGRGDHTPPSHESTLDRPFVGGDAHIAPPRRAAVSFRASDRHHWRGNPFPAPAGAETPASLCEAAQCAHWVVRSEAKLRCHGLWP